MGIIKFNNVPSTTPGLEVETFPNYVAPEKEYQVTHVPGRNGDLVVDTKTYKNVPRPYKVSMAVEPPAVSVSGSTASFEATAERALAECKTAINSDVGKVGTTIINSATDPVENNEPYNFRAVPNGVGDRENDTLIGGTVAWNQMCPDNFIHIESTQSFNWQPFTSQTVTFDTVTNHNYLVMLNGKTVSGGQIGLRDVAHSMVYRPSVTYALIYKAEYNSNGTVFCQGFWNEGTTDAYLNVIDLTQMFGSTIADYIYGLETATAGAGVAWFRNLFPKDYYAYNAGELISVKTEAHKMVGFNQWDEEWELGRISSETGEKTVNNNCIRSKNYIPTLPNTTYFYHRGGSGNFYAYFYDTNKNFIRSKTVTETTYTTPENTAYTLFYLSSNYGTTYNNDICINLSWDGERDGEYEKYVSHEYALNPALELRGIPKLNSSNKLYYDGDIYSSDGSVIRKYGVVDLGDLTGWSYNSTQLFWYHEITGIKSNTTNTICEQYSSVDKSWASLLNYEYGISGTNIRLHNDTVTTSAQLEAQLSGCYILFELSTPIIESTSGLIDNVSIASFDDGADNEPVNSLVVDITAIESGSGEKSPTNPYTISGFDSGIVTRCGKNLFDKTNNSIILESFLSRTGDTYIITSGTNVFTAFVRCKANTSYTVSKLAGSRFIIGWTKELPTNGVTYYGFTAGSTLSSLTVTTGNDAKYIVVYFYNGTYPDGYTYNDYLNSLQIEENNQATTYEAYNGTTYTFAFGQTVYGGHFDNKGNLVVTHGFYTFTGTENLGSLSGNRIVYTGLTDIYIISVGEAGILTCSHYREAISGGASINNAVYKATDNVAIVFRDDTNGKSTTNFANYLATQYANGTPVQVAYKLATPITLAITSQDIPTLLGVNNIFSNTGNIKSLSYPKQVCPFEPAQEVDNHGTEEYVDNREVAIPVGHESKYFTAGKIYNFSWLDEAGLIKEGELNADTGVLTITNGYGIVDLGDLTWMFSSSTSEYFSTPKSAINEGMIALSCSVYKVYTTDPSLDKSLFQTSNSIRIRDSSFFRSVSSSVVDPTFKSAMHGVKLLYELADPVRTIQLTPVQVESLIGNNVLISESGNISVTPRTYSTYTEKMNAISDWLHSASGYARLEDTYEPDYYRKAYYDEQTDMENIFNEAGQATLNFICKPQRYLKSGEEPITISSGGLIQNRTRYEAYPILKVTTNNTQGSVAIGNHSITIKAGAGTDPITIDCELQDAWSGTSNKNSYIVLTDGEFPVIDPGAQTVTFDGGVQSVEVIPRWWTV